MTDRKTKKPRKPGQLPFTIGIVLLVLGGLFAVLCLTSTTGEYVGGRMVETQGTPTLPVILMIIAGIILASLGYLKKR